MRTSPPARAPKWKLAVGPSSTGGHCNPPKKDTPRPKTKRKLQWDGRRGTITIKSNPIPTSWVTHKLENNNTKEVLPLLWRFWTPCQYSHPWDLTVRLGIPRESDLEGQRALITGLSEDWKKQTPVLEGTNKILHMPRPRAKEQLPHRRLNQNYFVVLEGFLWRCGSAGAHHKGSGSSNLGRSSLA